MGEAITSVIPYLFHFVGIRRFQTVANTNLRPALGLPEYNFSGIADTRKQG